MLPSEQIVSQEQRVDDRSMVWQLVTALNNLHTIHTGSKGSDLYDPIPHPVRQCTLTEALRTENDIFQSREVALRFATKAAQELPTLQFRQLLRFLDLLTKRKETYAQSLQSLVDFQVQRFYTSEMQMSGDRLERLTKPGGPPDALLGIILHCQSEDDAIDKFWDPRSVTMNLLRAKGISEDKAFGFDWHWRAVSSFQRSSHCQTRAWSQELRRLHDTISHSILDTLPLPFVILASACAKDRFRKSSQSNIMTLEVDLPNLADNTPIVFDLDFRGGELRRIILQTHHPTAAYFAAKEKKIPMGFRLDAGINFFMWLIGFEHAPNFFVKEYANPSPQLRSIRKAPLMEVYQYMQTERIRGNLLQLHDYSSPFISWAGRYLEHDPSLIINDGRSLVNTVTEFMMVKRHQVQRSSVQKRVVKAHDSQNAIATTRSASILPTESETNSSHLGIHLEDSMNCDNVVIRKSSPPTSSQQGEEDEAMDGPIENPVALEADFLSPGQGTHCPIVHRGIDEVEVLPPVDDLVVSTLQKGEARRLFVQTELREIQPEKTSIHGSSVSICRSGWVKVPNSTSHLAFRLGIKEAIRIREIVAGCNMETKLYVNPTSVELRVGTRCLYEKAIEVLLGSPQGPEWLFQLSYERHCQPLSTDNNSESRLALLPCKPYGTARRSPVLRRRLLQGALFTPSRYSKPERCQIKIRDVQFDVPLEAIGDIFIQVFLVPIGKTHESSCVSKKHAHHDDPATRIGINLRYSTQQEEQKSTWVALKGNCQIKKLNSLVDFLENKDDDFTAVQPRRFLSKNITQNRPKAYYT